MNIKSIIPCFCKWHEENQERFLIKTEITNINENNVEMIFPAIPDILTAELYLSSEDCMGIRIAVERNGVIWDWIMDYDSIIDEVEGGYVCYYCEGEKTIYPTLENFAIEHTFEEVLTWCNDNIATAQGLALYGNADTEGYSSARLVPKDKNLSDFEPSAYYFPFDFTQSSSS
jgi:hypothetical protein